MNVFDKIGRGSNKVEAFLNFIENAFEQTKTKYLATLVPSVGTRYGLRVTAFSGHLPLWVRIFQNSLRVMAYGNRFFRVFSRYLRVMGRVRVFENLLRVRVALRVPTLLMP